MNENCMIHETVIRDILDVFDDIKNADFMDAVENRRKNKSFRSIASATSKLTLVFPVLTSRTMSIETASMVTKAIERKAVSMLQMLFSALSITNAEDGISYLKNFHTNLKLDGTMSVDKFMNVMDDLVTEGVILIEDAEIYEKYSNDLRNLSYYLPDSVNETTSISDYNFMKDPYSYNESVVLSEAINAVTPNGVAYDSEKFDTDGNYNLKVQQLDYQKGLNASNNRYNSQRDINNDFYTADRDRIRDYDAQRNYELKSSQLDIQRANQNLSSAKYAEDLRRNKQSEADNKARFDFEKEKFKHQINKDNRKDQMDVAQLQLSKDKYQSNLIRDNIDYLKNQLLDNDVKKSNELVPTTMIVNYISKGQDGKPVYAQTVIGVKAKMYPVASDDILNRLTLKHKDKNVLLGFIKSTTREISFFRDFLLCIDRAKLDALSQSKRGSSSKLWKVLERRGIKSRFKRAIGSINDASAITTLHITQEEVDYLKKTENIDLNNPKVIRPIMESYNFMCVCISDEVNEVAKFIFDTGDDIYEEMSFRNLEREDKGNDYKKIVNLMTKIR